MLERTWLHEQTHRRTEELEILSTISIALGQAETRENILAAIMDQLRHFFEASAGAFFFPDQSGAQLVIKHSLDSSQVGLAYPQGDEPLWQVFQTAQPVVIRDASAFVRQNRQQVYRLLFHAVQSAVLLPLKAGEGSFGVLFLGYAERRHFTSQDLHLYQTIAEITGTSLRRAVMLEALEQQASVRTQHLSTLYSINAVTGKALDLTSILEQVLRITVEAMNGRAGLVHLISENGCEIVLAAQHNLSSETALRARAIRLDKAFWQDLVLSSNPLIVLDPRNEPRLPGALRQVLGDRPEAYLGALIKAMGQPLGLLSVFGAPSPGSTLEETTLFLTIADQLGTSVERARLVAQAEKAAVIQERQRLARELHDSVTQLLYSLVLFAGAGRKVMGQGNQDLLDEYLHRINQAALQALKEMRLLVYELRPTDYLEEGLVSALRHRLDAVEKRTGINALLTVEGELNLDEATEMALYRITQEALNNTLKHSGASQVSVDLRAHQGKVTLAITDNGSGFSLADKFTTGGLGISSIQERVAALGGQLEILSQPGQGAQISVTIEEAK
jgi:signal transduction histidine kinase